MLPGLDYARPELEQVAGAVDAAVLAELTALFATHQAFDLQLSEARRFPGVLYLAPEPAAALRALTDAVVSTWPEAPPYGGRFADVVPHLTVADSEEPYVLDVIVPYTEHVLPFIPAGKTVADMIWNA